MQGGSSYEQQRILFGSNAHSIPQRIVSLSQPFVRPIVRGKARARTEFGAKLHISLVDGFARIERPSNINMQGMEIKQ